MDGTRRAHDRGYQMQINVRLNTITRRRKGRRNHKIDTVYFYAIYTYVNYDTTYMHIVALDADPTHIPTRYWWHNLLCSFCNTDSTIDSIPPKT
mmetsp:Transcript_39771/g.82700  ORF Transcript_39771/g.82700 Transcript_39771/m.82700 type:complete len:94 (+) Transcript_39771:1127-1408(+)